MKLESGQTAVVTGAGSGIGRALAHAFGRRGLNVVALDIEAGPLDTVARELAADGVTVLPQRCDVTDPDGFSPSATGCLTGSAGSMCCATTQAWSGCAGLGAAPAGLAMDGRREPVRRRQRADGLPARPGGRRPRAHRQRVVDLRAGADPRWRQRAVRRQQVRGRRALRDASTGTGRPRPGHRRDHCLPRPGRYPIREAERNRRPPCRTRHTTAARRSSARAGRLPPRNKWLRRCSARSKPGGCSSCLASMSRPMCGLARPAWLPAYPTEAAGAVGGLPVVRRAPHPQLVPQRSGIVPHVDEVHIGLDPRTEPPPAGPRVRTCRGSAARLPSARRPERPRHARRPHPWPGPGGQGRSR